MSLLRDVEGFKNLVEGHLKGQGMELGCGPDETGRAGTISGGGT